MDSAANTATEEKTGPQEKASSFLEVFFIFLRLGLTSLGGPVAHLGYFREEFVQRRKWFQDKTYADIVALCQFMPGPASSQVGLAIGLTRAGYPGALGAWLGFTLPSAIILVLFAYGIDALGDTSGSDWLRGLKIVAVVVVAQAVWVMANSLCPDKPRKTLAVLAAAVVLLLPGVLGQLGAIAAGAMFGLLFLTGKKNEATEDLKVPVGKIAGGLSLLLFFVFLAGLPILAAQSDIKSLDYFDSFYRSGSLVFGGGHVVLPLLNSETVGAGLVESNDFLAGYGAAQAVPGPLFTFAAFLGSAMVEQPTGWFGAIICLVAIFLPSVFLVIGLLPFWNILRKQPKMQAVLGGVNAAVVGLLLAALYNPVWVTGIKDQIGLVIALAIFAALIVWKIPVWMVVILAALGTGGLGYLGVF